MRQHRGTERGARRWDRLPRDVAEPPALEVLRGRGAEGRGPAVGLAVLSFVVLGGFSSPSDSMVWWGQVGDVAVVEVMLPWASESGKFLACPCLILPCLVCSTQCILMANPTQARLSWRSSGTRGRGNRGLMLPELPTMRLVCSACSSLLPRARFSCARIKLFCLDCKHCRGNF